MTAIDNIKAALEAVSSSGAWHKSGPAIDIDESDDWPAARVEVRANRLINRKIAAFIAACNPSAIRELLAYVESLERERAEDQGVIAVWRRRTQEAEAKVESLEKDAGRWRIIRKQHEECDSGITMCVFQPVNGESLEPVGCMPGELDAAVDAIDAAMEQTK